MAKGKPRKPCVHWNKGKQKRCQDAWQCGEVCESYFTDDLFLSACYSNCKANPDVNIKKCDVIENIGFDRYFTQTGTAPDCDGFDLMDTAQGQAFQMEVEAAESYNEMLGEQQQANTDIQKQAIVILALLIIAIVAYLLVSK